MLTSTTPKVTGTVRSKNPLKGALEIIPVSKNIAACVSALVSN